MKLDQNSQSNEFLLKIVQSTISDKFLSNFYFGFYWSGFGRMFFPKSQLRSVSVSHFLENNITNQHHLRSVNRRSLGRQLTLYDGKNQSRIVT